MNFFKTLIPLSVLCAKITTSIAWFLIVGIACLHFILYEYATPKDISGLVNWSLSSLAFTVIFASFSIKRKNILLCGQTEMHIWWLYASIIATAVSITTFFLVVL